LGISRRDTAKLFGVDESSVRKAIKKAIDSDVPAVDADGSVSEEFIAWYKGKRGVVGSLDEVTPVITGLTSSDRVQNTEDLWNRVIEHQKNHVDKIEKRYSQTVEIPDYRPILLVLLSDIHLGNKHCDYINAKADAELVRDTPGVYSMCLGDVADLWITPKLAHIQREQPIPLSDEYALLESWLDIMDHKLLCMVSGNHDLRAYNMAGIDVVQKALKNIPVLYDQHEIRFTLKLGDAAWRWKLRHSFERKSQYNPSHGIEFDAKFQDGTFDFAVEGHRHNATMFREFYDHAYDRKIKLAVTLGCYELDSAYGRQLNCPRSTPGGSAGIMLWPDGTWQSWHNIKEAVKYLEYVRNNFPINT
jgi:hypothetical protein